MYWVWLPSLVSVCLLLLLALLLYSVYFQSRCMLYVVERLCPAATFRFNTRLHLDQKTLALTIDDAPSRAHMPEILDLLSAWDVCATFFVIGNYALENPCLMTRMVEENHELGNHTMHDFPSFKLDPRTLVDEIRHTDALIDLAYQQAHKPRPSTKWFRPGSGLYNKHVSDACRNEGYRLVLGSCYPFDPQITSPWWNSKHIMWTVSPGRIVIVHDRHNTISLLKRILPKLKNAGYQFKTLSELSSIR